MSRRVLSIVLSLVMVLNISFTNGMIYANENDNLSEALQENDYENNESQFNDEEQTIFDSIVSEEDEEDLDNLESEAVIISNGLDNEEMEEDEIITTEYGVGNDIEEDEEDLDNLESEADIISNGLDNEEPEEDEVITTEFDVGNDIEEDDELLESESYYNSEVILYNEIDENETNININESTTVSQTDTIIESTQESSDVVEENIVISTSSDMIEINNEVNSYLLANLFGDGENNNITYTLKFVYHIPNLQYSLPDLAPLEKIKNTPLTHLYDTNDIKEKGLPDGYKLKYWTKAQQDANYGKRGDNDKYVFKENSDFENPRNNETLKAVWDVQITYDNSGRGQLNKTSDWVQWNVECNAYLPKLDDITGYKFKGWSLAQEGARDAEDKVYSKNSGDKLIIDKPTKLYALWEEENYKVTLNTNVSDDSVKIDNSLGYTQDNDDKSKFTKNRNYSELLILPTANQISRTGYSFLGWYLQVGSGTPITQIDANTDVDKYFTAKWKANTYTITYELNGGCFANDNVKQTINYDEGFTDLPVPDKKGYTFKGWFSDSEFTENNKITQIKKEKEAYNHILYAKWDEEIYNIKYKTSVDGTEFTNDNWIDGYTIYPENKWYTQEIILPTSDKIKVREISESEETKYYLFKGWALTTNQTEIIDKIPANTDFDSGEIELFAHWVVACKITLNNYCPNESDEANKNLTIYIQKNQPLSYEHLYPTADGKKFTKWTKDDSDYNVDSPIVNDITLTAIWEDGTTKKIEFENTSNTNAPTTSDFTKPQPQYLLENDKVKEPKAPNVFGYKFLGWYLDDSTSNKFDFNTVTDGNLTLYAQWQLIDWNINYELNYGSWNNFQPTTTYNIKSRSIYQLPKNVESSTKLTKNHYTFGGWYKSSSFVDGSEVEILNNETGDLTLYAKWTLETGDDSSKYNSINFVSNGGDGFMPTQHVFENETSQRIHENAFIKNGYVFVNWVSQDGTIYEDKAEIEYSENKNLILTAIWQQKPQQIITPNNRRGSEYWGGGGTGGGGGGGGVSYSPSMNVPATIHNNQMIQNAPTNTEAPRIVGFSDNNQNRVNSIKKVSGILDGRTSQWVSDSQTGKWKLYNANGIQAWNGFYQLNNVVRTGTYQRVKSDTYYFDSYGQMVTGWVQTADNNWYYFETQKTENEGKMITGWKQINGDYYYFRNDGSMVTNGLTPDGRIVGADGKLLKFNM